MRFFASFAALLALAIGMIFVGLNLVMGWLLQAAMLAGGAIILALDAFALLVWFVNWRYYPE